MASSNALQKRSGNTFLKIEPLHKGSTRVQWTLYRDKKIVVTDIAENRKAAQSAARKAFAADLVKNIPKIDGAPATEG